MEPAHARDLLIPLTHTEMLWLSVWVEWVNLERARVPLPTYAYSWFISLIVYNAIIS